MEQSLTVSEALRAGQGIERLQMDLAVCRPDAVRLFLDYIASTKSLHTLIIAYDVTFVTNEGDSLQLQKFYWIEMDKIFYAVLQNTSIQRLETSCLEESESLIELLSKTLTSFKIDTVGEDGDPGGDPSADAAFRTAAGFSRNASLKQVEIACVNSS
jgi:hypothetical protein